MFSYEEDIITFPFTAKTQYRDSASIHNKVCFKYVLWEKKNSLKFYIPQNTSIANEACGNFYFMI